MNIYEQYALLDAQENDIKNKKETLRVEILQAMIDCNKGKEETTLGTFSVIETKQWNYPQEVIEQESATKEAITALQEKVKVAKTIAESTGVASCIKVPSLRFTKLKL